MSRISQGQVAVFTRNHRRHLDEAVALCAANQNRKVTFRASTRWASAEQAMAVRSTVPIYMAAVGGPGMIEYVAELCDLQTYPHRGDLKTERLLSFSTNSTKDEGLWEKYEKDVKTLYVIWRCRVLRRPFPISNLTKASDNSPLSADFKYSYSLVFPSQLAT